ncbi:hypothetical protein [Streptomyces sp. G1]|uniref:hypothetical protein n=1 Tax=Streptomyces sp. G1 TaxID=361572 RepID=UPI002030D04D|nr:hypothetical protein [Streptomyces sp. G1]MCM1964821.1 hypothetical protein [Streptomyces sp. G1]
MDVLLYLGAAAGALLAVGAVARVAWGINRRVVTIVDLVQELSPDHGRSIKDQVTETARDVAEIKGALTDLCGRFDRHLSEERRA